MRVNVILFGGLRQIAGRREVGLDLPPASAVSAAIERLGLPGEAVGLAAVSGEVVALDAPLSEGDELALFSPVGGG